MSVNWGGRSLVRIGSITAIDWQNLQFYGTWLFREGVALSPFISNGNITLSNIPFYINTGNSICTWTLPSVSNSNGVVYQLKNRGNTITLTGTATDKIFAAYSVPSFVINSGEAYQLISDGQFWCVT